jgi:TetR/AcrR family transcriptional regulator, cholesterol catabolism regulator
MATTTTKLNRKQQIELHATMLFREKGYAAASMRDLAQRLGLEAASLYSHINSKEEILQSIIFRMADSFFETLDSIPEDNSHSPLELLEKYIIAHIQVITQNTAASAVFFQEWRHLSEPHMSRFLQLRNEYEERFRQIIRQAIAQEEVVVINEKFAVFAILSSLNWTHTWYKPNGKMSPQEIGKNLADMLISGLKAK